MDYLEEYRKIFEGGKFIRKGTPLTFKEFRAFDGGGTRCLMDVFLKELEARESVTVLDYGCGEAIHWHKRVLAKRTLSLPEIMGLKLRGFTRYDPCYSNFSKRPVGKFDFIICSDVLEHIPEDQLAGFFADLYSFLEPNGVVFYGISTKPSNNVFLDGTNMHVTQKPPAWWVKIIKANSNPKCKNNLIFDGIPG